MLPKISLENKKCFSKKNSDFQLPNLFNNVVDVYRVQACTAPDFASISTCSIDQILWKFDNWNCGSLNKSFRSLILDRTKKQKTLNYYISLFFKGNLSCLTFAKNMEIVFVFCFILFQYNGMLSIHYVSLTECFTRS